MEVIIQILKLVKLKQSYSFLYLFDDFFLRHRKRKEEVYLKRDMVWHFYSPRWYCKRAWSGRGGQQRLGHRWHEWIVGRQPRCAHFGDEHCIHFILYAKSCFEWAFQGTHCFFLQWKRIFISKDFKHIFVFFQGQEGSSRSMLIGTLVHELLQESLRNGLRSQKEVQQQLETCLQQSYTLKSLMGLTMSQDEIRKEVEPFLPHIVFFVETYVLGKANKVPFIYYISTFTAQNLFCYRNFSEKLWVFFCQNRRISISTLHFDKIFML